MSNTPNPLPPPPALLRAPLMTQPPTSKPVAFTASTEKVKAIKPGSLQWGLAIVGASHLAKHIFCHYMGCKTFNQLKALPYSDIWHSLKVMVLQAWYLDWSTKPADTCRDITYALTKESYDDFLGEVNIKDLEQQEANPSAPLSESTKPNFNDHCCHILAYEKQNW